jgi:DNA-nicking Smr family endonuclease
MARENRPGGPTGDRPGAQDAPSPDAEPAPVEVEIGTALDLHEFAPRDVPMALAGYLEAARERGFREVRVVHGKGKGVQRARVHQLLAQSPHVLEFHEGPPERGGWGATIVRLREPAVPAP